MKAATASRPKAEPIVVYVTSTPATELLDQADLQRLLKRSEADVRKMVRSGTFPKPDLYIGKVSPRWLVTTYNAWIADKVGKRAQGEGQE